tara:strand:+ start:916 stop:3480 length:2565 start_codon:yes stop_codon:yes gene_type:complete
MTGSSSFWFAKTGAADFYGHNLNYSIATNGNEYMTDSVGAGDVKKWTFSFWVKPQGKSWFGEIWSSAGSGHAGGADIEYLSLNDGQVYHYQYRNGTLDFNVKSAPLVRDNTNWTHIVVVKDTAQSTASDRIKFYINGTLVTDLHTATYPSQDNGNGYINSSLGQVLFHEAARWRYPTYCLFSEMHFCDAQAYAASDFGEFKEGVWIPIEPSVSYGTTGWHLDFADSSALGNDVSGNNNDWSTSNFGSQDRKLDNPTNNFATLDTNLHQYQTTSFSGGFCTATGSGSSGAATYRVGTATHACHAKTYFEVRVASMSGNGRNGSGFLSEDTAMDTYGSLSTAMQGVQASQPHGTAQIRLEDATVQTGAENPGSGDIVMWAFDPDSGKIWHGVNGTWSISGDPAAGSNNVTAVDTREFMLPAYHLQASSDSLNFNFGQDPTFDGNLTGGNIGSEADENGFGLFKYAVPSGFLALCSRNMPDPSLGPHTTEKADDHFDTKLWSGDNTDTRNITDYGFQPDFVWIKNRTTAVSHVLFDSVRGVSSSINTALASDQTDYEGLGDNVTTSAQFGGVSAFLSNGFTLTEGNTDDARYTNKSSNNYVGWAWKGGASTTNDASSTGVGSIDSTYRANTDAGFSIVSYTGTGSDGTIAHGLSSKPELIITKSRSDSDHWYTYCEFSASANPEQYELYLNLTTAAYKDSSDNTRAWNATAPTSTVFSIGDIDAVNESGDTFVAYCFHSVYGFSRIGAYEGNGNTTGPRVYTGFTPTWVMIKRFDSTGSWYIYDITRLKYNPLGVVNQPLPADSTNAEGGADTSWYLDFQSNGFRVRNSSNFDNANNGRFIYLAFASLPFKYSNGRA